MEPVNGIMRNTSVKIFGFGPVVQQEIAFKDITYLEFWRPSCLAERNHLYLGDFVRGHYEKNLCEIILSLDQCFRRSCHFKNFLI